MIGDSNMAFNIYNRRYTGSKNKLLPWIKKIIIKECKNASSFFDIFAGTGSVTYGLIDQFDEFYINDFLFSNEIIYNAFFSPAFYDYDKLTNIAENYCKINESKLKPDFVTNNYTNKYFSYNDSLIIDYIRNDIEMMKEILNPKEYNILLASLIYSFDRCANTVGHYEAFIKAKEIKSSFKFELINPVFNEKRNKKINIYRNDANKLAEEIYADIVYIDPPYSSRQYSRFYHVIETIAKWNKPELFGKTLKPAPENLSDYSKVGAVYTFDKLITSLKTKYIVVSYNNTYDSRSNSSKNKMSLEQITQILEKKGKTKIFYMDYKAFNAGKTNFNNHQEIIFVTKVGVK